MLAYRCLKSLEIFCLINNEDYSPYNSAAGDNNFKYEDDIGYKHFFMFDDHAEYYKPRLWAATIEICEIPDEIIDQYGFGFYDVVSSSKSSELYPERIPLPEIIIKEKDFDKKYIKFFTDTFKLPGTKLSRTYKNKYDKVFNIGDEEYTYADIYYEMLCHLVEKHQIKPKDAVKYIQLESLREQLKEFFEDNHSYFEEQVMQLKQKRTNY